MWVDDAIWHGNGRRTIYKKTVSFNLESTPEWTPKASKWGAKYSSMMVAIIFAPIPEI